MGALALSDARGGRLEDLLFDALKPGARRQGAPACPVCSGAMHRLSAAGEPLALRCGACLSVLSDDDAENGSPVQLRLVT
jgi:hypothetical protein